MSIAQRIRLGAALLALVTCDRAQPAHEPEKTADDEPTSPATPVAVQTPEAFDEADAPEHARIVAPGPADGASEPLVQPPSDGWVRGRVRSGDSLSEILVGIGLGASTTRAILAALSAQMDPAKIRVGQAWAARIDEDGALETFEFALSKTRTVVVEPRDDDDDDAFDARTVESKTELEVATICGTVDSSLWESVTRAGEDGSLVPLLVDVLASNIDFYTETRQGDRFAVVVEKELLEGDFLRYGRVLAVAYRGAAGHHTGVWWQPPDKSGGYFDVEGKSLEHVFLKSPLKFTRVSSQFNPKRMHPVLHRVKGHYGTDYAAPEGTPVWAAADGRIVFRAAKGGAGNMVILAHDSGLKTLYMHLSRFEDGQKVGARVQQKTVIGYVGQTGLATGPHLHFGVQRKGRYVDPQEVKSVPRPGVPPKHRGQFVRQTRALFERLDRAFTNEDEKAATARVERTPSDAAPG